MEHVPVPTTPLTSCSCLWGRTAEPTSIKTQGFSFAFCEIAQELQFLFQKGGKRASCHLVFLAPDVPIIHLLLSSCHCFPLGREPGLQPASLEWAGPFTRSTPGVGHQCSFLDRMTAVCRCYVGQPFSPWQQKVLCESW